MRHRRLVFCGVFDEPTHFFNAATSNVGATPEHTPATDDQSWSFVQAFAKDQTLRFVTEYNVMTLYSVAHFRPSG